MVKNEKLKDYTLYQYRLLNRVKVPIPVLILFIFIWIGGYVFIFHFLEESFSIAKIMFSIILLYSFHTLISLLYCYSKDLMKPQFLLSTQSLYVGLVTPKALLTKQLFRHYELSMMFLSLVFIVGLYVWVPFSLWALISYTQCLTLFVRLILYIRSTYFTQFGFIRYESQGLSEYSTDGK